MLTDTIFEDARWQAARLDILAETAAMAALSHLTLDPAKFEIAILACDDARIAGLNADFRGKPQPTNVLSWPAFDLAPPGDTPLDLPPSPAPQSLGDIAIAYETCAKEAQMGGIPLTDHALHLIVHAVLHLLGHDHIADADAQVMERLESAILGKLGVADPYSNNKGHT